VIRIDHDLIPSAKKNDAICRTETSFVVLVGNNTVVQPGWLGRLHHACEKHPEDTALLLILEGRQVYVASITTFL
jgi:hypothetical protein